MADEYKEEAYAQSEKGQQPKGEVSAERMVDDCKQERILADIGKDEVNEEGKNEGISGQIKEPEGAEQFAGDFKGSSIETNNTTSDVKRSARVAITGKAKAEKPNPVKRGLFDEPVVREGKRQRHAVERLAAVSSPSPRKTSLDAVGSGTSLGDIEFVNSGISKAQNETLKWLHRLCYGTPGTASSRKRNLRRFNGFAFDEESADFDKKKATAMKFTNNELHMIGRILGSERGHTKEEAVMNVLHFLQKPEDKGRKITLTKKRRSSSKSTSKRAKKRKVERKGNKKSVKSKESSENDNASQSGEESSDDEDGEEKKSESTSITKIRSEKTTLTKSTSVLKSSTAKENPTWGDDGPSDAEVETAINEILRSVDLVNCTMKQMCERIAEKFPSLDMTTYKSALKERVKVALEKMEDS